jgi:GT2 family glycosyltransferase
VRRLHPDSGGSDGEVELMVAILAYGAAEKAVGLLSHLRPQAIPTVTETIVVHNPSSPGETLDSSQLDGSRVLQMAVNEGYVRGMNAGIELALQSEPTFVLLLTHDARIAADDVHALVALMREQPRLGVLGPVLCGPDRVAYSAGFMREKGIRMQHRLPGERIPRPVWPCAAIDGSVMLWRAAALREVGGFDERFFMYFDDVELCSRAVRRGWQIAVASDVRALSAPGKGSRSSAHAYLRARNGLAYARGFGPAGLLAGLAECAVGAWHATPKPGGRRFGDPQERRLAAAYWRGTTLGVFDYFRGRWGPPPPRVARDSDIAAT